MPLETANYVNQLVQANPLVTDFAGDAYEHLNLIKKVLVQSFPNLNAQVTANAADLNLLTGTAGVGALLQLPSGTFTIFGGPTAPPGWTQVITLNDMAFRVVSGTGGGSTGGSWTISGLTATMSSHTLTIDETPVHSHSVAFAPISVAQNTAGISNVAAGTAGAVTGSTGGGGSHTSLLSVTADGTWRPQYIDTLVCVKN